MKLINFFFLAFLVVSGCSNIEFVLKNKNNISPLNNKINFEVSGKNYEYVAEALIKHFGSIKKEDDKIYSLNVEIVEEMIKTVIDTNQVSSSVQYNILLNYTLIGYSGNCKKIQKTYKSKFTHYPKSEGYNFGSDQALLEAYKSIINENVFSFKNYLSNNEEFIRCINEG